MKSLYITHYGILEPLGQSQVLPYLIGLSRKNISIDILSFEKSGMLEDRSRVLAQQRRLLSAGINWFPRPYSPGSSLPGLLHSIFTASCDISRRCRQDSIDLIHCRSHVPCLMAWLATLGSRKPILFDFRGFQAEEMADAGLWKPDGMKFKLTKWVEARLLHRCNSLVVLTQSAAEYFLRTHGLDGNKIFVIPCCTDLSAYLPAEEIADCSDSRPLRVVYSGSTAGRYNLPAMLSFFSLILKERPGSRLTVLSTSDLSPISEIVRQSGLSTEAVDITTLAHQEVPAFLSTQDIGLMLIKGGRALMAASPTKVGEYLASGLAIVAEDTLGGFREMFSAGDVGCLINSNRPETWPPAVARILAICTQPDLRQKAKSMAAAHFDLKMGVELYARAYRFAASRET